MKVSSVRTGISQRHRSYWRGWGDALTIAIVSFMPSVCPCVYWQNTKKKGSLPSLASREIVETEMCKGIGGFDYELRENGD